MIYVINYADDSFKLAQKLNTKLAYKHGADKVIEYSFDDLSDEFKTEYKEILANKRGAGYWVWKPYVIYETLNKIDEDDYLIYIDSGCAPIMDLKILIKAMENANVSSMPFVMSKQFFKESQYTKRDVFVYLGLDEEKYRDSAQFLAGIQIHKKCNESVAFVKEWLDNCKDIRMISDMANTCGLDNYPDFIENRHDQSIYSLLCKKYELKAFRDPLFFRRDMSDDFDYEIWKRSPYPQMFDAHRNGQIISEKDLTYKKKYLTVFYWKTELYNLIQRLIK